MKHNESSPIINIQACLLTFKELSDPSNEHYFDKIDLDLLYTKFKQDKAVLQAKFLEDFDDSVFTERIFKETNKAYMIRLTLENENQDI